MGNTSFRVTVSARTDSRLLRNNGVESRLLLEDIGRGGLGRLAFEREMHPFVAAVLLGMAGLRPLEVDDQPEPPDGQLLRP